VLGWLRWSNSDKKISKQQPRCAVQYSTTCSKIVVLLLSTSQIYWAGEQTLVRCINVLYLVSLLQADNEDVGLLLGGASSLKEGHVHFARLQAVFLRSFGYAFVFILRLSHVAIGCKIVSHVIYTRLSVCLSYATPVVLLLYHNNTAQPWESWIA
jgi:hypothetical protein